MEIFRCGKLVNLTLFFFIWMLLFPSAYADQSGPANQSVPVTFDYGQAPISMSPQTNVYYVTPEEARRLEDSLRQQGYEVKRGTPEQLMRLRNGDLNNRDYKRLVQSDPGEQIVETDAKKKREKQKQEQEQAKKRKNGSQAPSGGGSGNVNVNVSHGGSGGFGGGGGGGDAAAVLFVLVGVFVAAVFVIYTIKYLVDIASGKEYDYWWDLGAQKTYLITHKGEHGEFTSAKLASGYIADKRAYIGLVGELGYMDINLDVSKNDAPVRLNLEGYYWMLGAAARFVLFDSVRDGVSNPSFFFMEFMGGLTEHAATETIGSAKLGLNFGEFDHFRIGLHAGAQYIGLNKKQGFVHNSDNYWFTYGFELGYRF